MQEKKKRPAIGKQEAYVEFKNDQGKKIEDSIVMSRDDMKKKRDQVQIITKKINGTKSDIDRLKV